MFKKFLIAGILFAICTAIGTSHVAPCLARSDIITGESSRNMVATVHPLATDAGVMVLREGGNAVDAAIAAGLTLSVVDGFNSGIGGGCFVLIRTADGETIAIDGREIAPKAAHRDMYLVNGKPDTTLSQIGPLAIGVPGALKAYEQAVREHGKTKFSDLIADAAKIAADGFEVNQVYSQNLKSAKIHLQYYPGSRAALLKDDGSVYQPGEILRQPDLAHTYRQIAQHGVDWFYRGEFARRCAEWLQANGGVITAHDFKNYTTVRREPIKTTYRGYTVYGFPPPSSGGVHVAQILNILEQFDLKSLYEQDRTKFVHVVTEAMKLAFADRAYWLGDPDFAKVPRGLIDKKYAAALAANIDMNRVTTVDSYRTPPRADAEFFERHTTHIAAADAAGNWVAITTTVNTTFGSKVIVPGLGVVMNNQMDDFSIAPGTPNAFGLIGNEANSVQPGKRPLSSMSPTIILREGNPIMTVGAAGGPKIITQALLAIIRRID
ncbi:MAG: gamma-glutamyltransferase, partial [candidate division Zixibacteria bacterium]